MAQLTVFKEKEQIQQYVIRKKLVSIGRSTQCDIVLGDKDVSSLHANIITLKDRYRLIDLDSTNGTYVGRKKITEQFLEEGAVIRIGKFKLNFSEHAELEKTAVVRPDHDYLEKSQKLVEELKKTHLTAVSDKKTKTRSVKTFEKKIDDLSGQLTAARIAHKQLKTLFDLSDALNSAKGYETVLKLILTSALEALGMERGAVVLYDEDHALETVLTVSLEKEKEAVISLSVVKKAIETDEILVSADSAALGDLKDARSIVTQKIKAAVSLPLKSRTKKMLGALYMDSRTGILNKDNLGREFLRMFSIYAATAIQSSQLAHREKQASEALAAAREREKYDKQLKVLEAENKRLVTKAGKTRLPNILGASAAMDKLFNSVEKVAPTDVTVLITGETGTGKSVVAKAIHDISDRKKKECVTIDCASIPSELLESELFGYEKGAFTGAVSQKKGRIELAEGGTLFMDEIGDMSLHLQAKLLRFLQEKSFERVGGTKTIFLNTRVIAATNKDLKTAVAQRLFREDLYYRLCGVSLHVPPLRERGEDVLVLANAFLDEARSQNSLGIKGFSPEAKNTILHFPWEGNVRQLRNVIQRAAILCNSEFISLEDLGLEPGSDLAGQTLKEAREEIDIRLIKQQMVAQKGNLSKAAKVLGVDRSTLRELMKKYDIQILKSQE